MIGCHYRRLPAGDLPASTRCSNPPTTPRSNWTPEIQHGSPPLALMTKLIEELADGSGLRIGRLSLDILGAIPVAPVRVRAWVERPGSRISMMAAEMLAARPGGPDRAVARVTAWLLAVSDTSDVASDRYPPLVEGEAEAVPHSWEGAPGYLEAVSWRRQRDPRRWGIGGLARPAGPLGGQRGDDCPAAACAGGRLRQWRRSRTGSSTVHVHEHRHRGAPAPAADRTDFALRARGSIGPDGIGVTTAEIFDRQGFIGTCAQTLLVQRQP